MINIDILLEVLPDQQVIHVLAQDTCLFVGSVAEIKKYPYKEKFSRRDIKQLYAAGGVLCLTVAL